MSWKKLLTETPSASDIASSPSSGKVLKVGSGGALEWATDSGGSFETTGTVASFVGTQAKIKTTSADAVGVVLELLKHSASPANNDVIGTIAFDNNNWDSSGDGELDGSQNYAQIIATATNVESGASAGKLEFKAIHADTLATRLTIDGTKSTFTNNVGIGATSPSEKLEIEGNIKLRQNDAIIWNTNDAVLKSNFSQPAFTFHSSGGELFSLERVSSTIVFKNRTGNGYSTIIDADGDTIIQRSGVAKLTVDNTKTTFGGYAVFGSGTAIVGNNSIIERMTEYQGRQGKNHKLTFESDGSVGLRTDSTSDAFVIADNGTIGMNANPSGYDANANNLVIGDSGHSGITIASGTGSNAQIYFADGTSGDDPYRGIVRYDQANNAMSFWTDATQRVTINSSGNVGVGTTAPQELLHLYGTSGNQRLEIEATTAEPILKLTTGVKSWSWSVDPTEGNLRAYTYVGDSNVLTMKSDGKVGIGTDAPSYNLTIDNTGSDAVMSLIGSAVRLKKSAVDFLSYDGAYLDISSASALDLNTGGSQRLRIDSSGTATFAGIVDATNYKVSGAQGTDGQVLTSTGSGVAWEDSGGLWDVAGGIEFSTAGNKTITHQVSEADIHFAIRKSSSVYTIMTLDGTDQRVGIGTTSPSVNLHVQNDDLSNSVYDSNSLIVAENNDFAFFQTSSATRGGILFGDAGSASAGYIVYDHTDQSAGADAMRFVANATEAMQITSDGQVKVNVPNTNNRGLLIGTSASITWGNPELQYNVATDQKHRWNIAGSEEMLLDATNGLDLKTNKIKNWNSLASQGNLYLDNAGAIDSRGSGDLTFRTTDALTTRMVIKNDGKVGIAVTPSAPLHLSGSTSASSTTEFRIDDSRTGDDSITAGGYIAFHTQHTGSDKQLGYIYHTQAGTTHGNVEWGVRGTLSGAGNKKMVANKDNGVWYFYNNYTEDLAMVIKDQKVGIGGVTAPDNDLHIKNDDNHTVLKMESGSANHFNYLKFEANRGAQHDALGQITWQRQGANNVSITGYRDGTTDGYLKFDFGGTSKHIFNSTSVGIGTLSPTTQLHVEGNVSGNYATQIINAHSNGLGLMVRGGASSASNPVLGLQNSTQATVWKANLDGSTTQTGVADVANLKVAGAQGSDGQVLTSTGSGVAWEAVPTGGSATGIATTGDTTIDSSSGNVLFKDDGTQFGKLSNESSGENLRIRSGSGAGIALDFSAGTWAKFYGKLGIGGITPTRPLHIQSTDASATVLLENTTQDASGGAILNSISFNHNATLNSNLEHGAIGYYAGETWDDTKFYQTINNGNAKQAIAENIRGNKWNWYVAGAVRMFLDNTTGLRINDKGMHVGLGSGSLGGYMFHDFGTTYGFKGLTNADFSSSAGSRMAIVADGAELMTWHPNQKVGISIDAPEENFHINSAGATTGLMISNSATDGDPYLVWRTTGSTAWAMGIDDGDSDVLAICQSNNLGSNRRVTITQAGEVGMGADPFESGAIKSALTISNNSDLHVTLKAQNSAGNAFINFANSGDNSSPDISNWQIGRGNSGAFAIANSDQNNLSGGVYRNDFVILQSGIANFPSGSNVGINTYTPARLLEIKNATADNTDPQLRLQAGGTTSAYYDFGVPDVSGNRLRITSNASSDDGIVELYGIQTLNFKEKNFNIISSNNFSDCSFQAGATRGFIFKPNDGAFTAMKVHYSGTKARVGINHTSPTYALDILNDGDNQFRVGRSASKFVRISDDVMAFTGMTGNGMRVLTTDAGYLRLGTNNTADRITINSNGQVAINDSNPQDTLQVDHASGTGGNTLSVNANGVTGKGTLYVENRIGIGTATAPDQPLHIKIDNNNSDPYLFIENANNGGRSHARFWNSSRNTYWSFGQDSDDAFKWANHVHFGDNIKMILDTTGRLYTGGNLTAGTADATAYSAQFTDTAGTNAIHQFGQFYTNYRAEGASIKLGRHAGTSTSRTIIADNGSGDGTVLGGIDFRAYTTGGGAPTFHLSAQIKGVTDGNYATNSAPGALVFFTHKDYATSGDHATERMRIGASGRVGIGETSPANKTLTVKDSGAFGGTIHHVGASNKSSGTNTYSTWSTNDSSNAMQLTVSSNTNAYFKFQAIEQNVNYRDIVFNTDGGRVGIGITAPAYTFDCASTGDLGRFSATNGGGYPIFHLSNGAGSINSGTILQFSGGSASGQIKFNGINSTTSELMFLVESGGSLVQRMKINSSSRISLSNNDAGSSNTIFGADAGANIASGGNYSVLIGESAGNAITTNYGNTIIGWYAGATCDAGGSASAFDNVFVGKQTGRFIDDGQHNVALGTEAMRGAITGGGGPAGAHALYNVAVGRSSLYSISSGDENTAVGGATMWNSTEASTNTAIGYGTLYTNTTTGGNTAIGYKALYTLDMNNTGTPRSVAVGAKAGYYLDGGYDLTAVGAQAGEKSDDNYGNTYVGVVCGKNIDDGNYNTAVGGYALLGADADANDASYNVAVGYSSLQAITDGDKNTSLGNDSSKAITTGVANTSLGYKSNEVLTTGDMNVYIGAYTKSSAVGITNEVVLGAGASDGSDYLVGKGNDTVVIGGENGYIWNDFSSNATWTQVSDERTKKDIKDSDLGLSFINDLRPVTYKKKSRSEYPKSFDDYNENKTTVKDKKLYGFIAQEVKEAMDKASHSDFTAWTEGKDGMQGLGVTELITPLVKAVQELSAEIDRLKEQLNKES